ncbi:MAG TPA: glycosyltransferase family 4 protein [Verrucomicrobiae bacterium]
MRVTHIITRLVLGGAQENTLATIQGLRQRPGVEVNLISGPTIGPEGSLEDAARKLLGSAPGTLTIVPELVRPVHPLKDVIALGKLERILREQKPDLVHTHSGKAGILGRLAAKRASIPVIIHHIHGPSFGNFQGPLANLIFTAAEKYAARGTDHFFCSAEAMTKRYLAAGIGTPEMYTRIFSGFNLAPFLAAKNDPALRQQLGLGESDFVIGKVGRIFKLKGHADLVAAFAQLQASVPQARLLFVGDGSLRNEIENQVRALGLGPKVIFSGLVPPGEVARYIGIMDCVAHLSYREALSRVLPQALAAGKPVIAYDFDGADEVCREGETGFIIRTGDIGTAAERLRQLAAEPALRDSFGRRGREFVEQNFSVEKMVADQYTIYQKLAAQRKL